MYKKYLMVILAACLMCAGCSNTANEPVGEESVLTNSQNTEESVTTVSDENNTEANYHSLSEVESAINAKYSGEALQYPSSDENFEYNVYESYIQITKYIGNNDEVVFPSTIDGLPVRIIGSNSDETWVIDREKTPVKSIVIEPGIEIICHRALSCQGYLDESGKLHDFSGVMKSISLPEGLLYIGREAFYACGGLTELNLPETLQGIGDDAFCSAFADNAKVSVTIPESVVGIGTGAFNSQRNSLSDITILNRNTELCTTSFSGMSGNIISDKADGNEITVHGYAASTAAQLAADTRQKFIVIKE